MISYYTYTTERRSVTNTSNIEIPIQSGSRRVALCSRAEQNQQDEGRRANQGESCP